jgi:histidinol-phosphate aminotransferase
MDFTMAIAFLDLDTLRTHVPIEPRVELRSVEAVIANNFGIPESHVRVGASSLSLLRGLLDGINGPVILPMPDYLDFPMMVKEGVMVSRDGNFAPPMIDEGAAILLSNPNNPTGTLHDLRPLATDAAHAGRLLIVDEAYMEFANERHSVIPLIVENPNVVVARTMSKMYGMNSMNNGMRLGYLIGNPALLERVEAHGASELARKMAASLIGQPQVNNAARDVALRRGTLASHLRMHRCELARSETNYVMARGRSYNLNIAMEESGIDVVNLNDAPGIEGRGYCRIAVPSRQQMDLFVQRWGI